MRARGLAVVVGLALCWAPAVAAAAPAAGCACGQAMAPPAGGGLAKGAGACRRDPHRKPRPDGHGYYAACKHGGPRMMARLSAHRDRAHD